MHRQPRRRRCGTCAKLTAPTLHVQRIEHNINGQFKGEGRSRLYFWAKNTKLNWHYKANEYAPYGVTEAVVENLLEAALKRWGDASPIKLAKVDKMREAHFIVTWAKSDDDGNNNGSTLAAAFFPGDLTANQQPSLLLYPEFWHEVEESKVITLAHELGHIFGLRHTDDVITMQGESDDWAAFGKNRKISIMAYDEDCKMTDEDKSKLKEIYDKAWTKRTLSFRKHGKEVVYTIILCEAYTRAMVAFEDEAAYIRP